MQLRFRWLFLCLLLLCGSFSLCAQPAAIVPAAPDVLVVQWVNMAPLRALAEICGAAFSVDGRKITVTLGAHSFACMAGNTRAWQNGKAFTLSEAPFLLDDCCYAPLREFITALGGAIAVDAVARQAQLTLPGVAPFTVSLRLITGPPSQLAGTHESEALFLVTADGSRVQQLTYAYAARATTDTSTQAGPPSFTPDGASLLYVHGLDIVSRRLDSPCETVLTASFSEKGVENLLPRPNTDGTLYFAQRQHGVETTLCKIRLDGGGYRCLSVVGALPLFSADGRLIAYTAHDDNNQPAVHVMSVDGTDRVLVPGTACALSADGAMLCYEKLDNPQERGMVAEVNSSDGAVLWQSPSAVRDPFDIQFSPDGKSLLVPTLLGLSSMTVDGKNTRVLTTEEVRQPKFTADGTKIAFLHDGRLFLMNADGSAVRALAAGLEVNSFTISPDGANLVASGHKTPAQLSLTGAEAERRSYTAPTADEVEAARNAGTQTAVITTRRGSITVALYGKEAPLTVANFVKLVKSGFYNGLTFYMAEKGLAIRGGAPGGDGSAGPGYTIKLEIARQLSHVDGALAMARAGDPDSACSQFYITEGAQPQLDGLFAVFGQVVSGFDVVKKIRKGDAIISIAMKK